MATPLPILHLKGFLSTGAIGVALDASVAASPTEGITAIPGKCVVKDEEKEKT